MRRLVGRLRVGKETRTALRVWLAFAKSRHSSRYRFTIEDCRLHLRERAWRTPPVTVQGQAADLLRLQVADRSLFWPEGVAYDGLGWTYAEVFYPWRCNPSSYAHPQARVAQGGWVLDAGACEGFFTMYALERRAAVMAVEPVPSLQAALRRTFESELEQGRLRLFAGGIARRSGRATVHGDDAQIWNASIDVDAGGGAPGGTPTISIDELVASWDPQGHGLIKMDIEGSEMEALAGAGRTLKERRPALAVAVYHGYDNAAECRDIILGANPDYQVELRGMYGWFDPPRPCLLFAW